MPTKRKLALWMLTFGQHLGRTRRWAEGSLFLYSSPVKTVGYLEQQTYQHFQFRGIIFVSLISTLEEDQKEWTNERSFVCFSCFLWSTLCEMHMGHICQSQRVTVSNLEMNFTCCLLRKPYVFPNLLHSVFLCLHAPLFF